MINNALLKMPIDRFIFFFRILFIVRKILMYTGCIVFILVILKKASYDIVFLYGAIILIVVFFIIKFNDFVDEKLKKLEFEYVIEVYNKLNISKTKSKYNESVFRLIFSRVLVHFYLNEHEQARLLTDKVDTKNVILLTMKYSILFSIYGTTYAVDNFLDIKQKFLDLPKVQKFKKVKTHMEVLEKLFIERKPVELLEYSDYPIAQLEKYYFQGINFLNQQNFEQAKECFEQIKNERQDLYYVQEAKKYLVELNSN